jgi:hypothetical protein
MKPSLIILGAQKAGTSTLFDIMAAHPQTLAPAVKELDFFNRDTEYAQGLSHYLKHFPAIPLRRRDLISFEASPSYLYYADTCAPRIHAMLPNVLCVAILRDPVKRAYSSWNMYRAFEHHARYADLYETRGFEQAVEDELTGREQRPWRRYLSRSAYSAQLEPYMRLFPAQQLMIFGFPELKRDPHALATSICERLGIGPMSKADPVFGKRSNERPYGAPLDPMLAQRLRQHFAPEMEQLTRLIGRDLQIIEP